jgi:hypothetical protein
MRVAGAANSNPFETVHRALLLDQMKSTIRDAGYGDARRHLRETSGDINIENNKR